MDDDYDVICLGTGFKDCILGGLLSVDGKKVLTMDKNSFYGGESASLNLEQLYQRFRPEEEIPKELGRTRDYNVDLCSKLIMACGNLVKILLRTKVTRYLEFRSVNGSFVRKDGSNYKVPASASEAMSSSLMGFFEKRRFKNFMQYVQNYDQDDEKTWDKTGDAKKTTMREIYKYWGLDDNTISFAGHCLALQMDDAYLDQPAYDTIERIRLYAYSVTRYGNSPFIYPAWGLGGLPEGFSRLSAVHGGVFMLNKAPDEIMYDDDGRVCGVRCGEETAKCKQLIASPEYFIGTDKVKKSYQVARCICIMDHPIPGCDVDSCQLIIPGRQVQGRKSDMYISLVGWQHNVAAKGHYVAVVSARVESDDPKKELIPAIKVLGKLKKTFFWTSDVYEPTGDGSKDGIFITKSYDETSHFETATEEVIALYKAITGEDLDLTAKADPEDLQNE
eukprot:TRINITY_DN105661_c0_g1_i1.p1 TRINITY_DN105661_c0_g1~~TRINITY_DN105661_c0_g1_i1.p1  ORF type:complete len:447 (+),score=279.75 TRINITY_DN105661_c0_g1_i1:140-1480(+)